MQPQPESFARTLKDYAADYQWIRELGWPEDDLGQTQVHEVPDPAEDMINLTNFGGTRLPVSEADLVTSADLHDAVHNLYVYRSTIAPALWERLQRLVRSGGPAGADPTRAFEDATPVERDVSYARQMLDSYPGVLNVDAGTLAATIDALNDCIQACTADADADLGEQHAPELVKCIRLCLDCADVCAATVRVASRQTEYDSNITRPLLEACAATCKSCADECERHAEMHEHCRVCAEATRRCEQACWELLAILN